MISIGLVGLDTSHVTAFAGLLNDSQSPDSIPGARITHGWPGGSPDFDLSIGRVEGLTCQLRDQYGVEVLDSPEAVASVCDMVFITAVDGRAHPALLERVAPARKPVFVDKPFALSLQDAWRMVEAARAAGIPLMSCSSLRYAEGLREALGKTSRDQVAAFHAFGPMAEQPTQPGWFWYGCHTVEMLVAVMGAGAVEVHGVRTFGQDALMVRYWDGRMATIQGLRGAHHRFGGVIHTSSEAVAVDASSGRPSYAGMLEAILASLPQGRSDVPEAEMLEAVAIMEAANLSREQGGRAVEVRARRE
ncbi:MAG: Gfo/Idh/MocA family oxidoreductase [Terrimicrobiaceae bacterium]|nr:Gfo/Idh/MocA family oxidoreductase [Terrimicrobiaceae bacterium]